MSHARGRIHARTCAVHCVMYGDDPSPQCAAVDRMLDLVESNAVHQAVRDLVQEMDEAKWPRAVGPGVYHAVQRLDPYEEVEAFDPQMHDVHPGEFSDCPKCAGGVAHWHYKGTQTPVL